MYWSSGTDMATEMPPSFFFLSVSWTSGAMSRPTKLPDRAVDRMMASDVQTSLRTCEATVSSQGFAAAPSNGSLPPPAFLPVQPRASLWDTQGFA